MHCAHTYFIANSDLEFLPLIALNKPLYGTVVGPLHILREIARWQLTRLLMVSDAFAANAFSATRLVGAVAIRFVLLDFTLSHIRSTFDMPGFTSPCQDDDGGENAGLGAL